MKKYEILKPLKEDYKQFLKSLSQEEILSQPLSGEKVRLFHGTTTAYLNSILKEGILPRSTTQHHNWESNPSVESVVYLTNKWHYFYAYTATDEYMNRKYGEDYIHNPEYQWWNTFETLPCYIECHIPVELLVADEDFFFSDYALKKLNSALKKDKDFFIDYKESLSQYGTVGIVGKVDPKFLTSFTVMGDIRNLMQYFISSESTYHKEYQSWQQGKGKGKLKLLDLMKREEETFINGTWFVKDLPKNSIARFGVNPNTNRISIQLLPS